MNRDEALLFRWVGKHIEGSRLNRTSAKCPRLRDAHRDRYLENLEDVLDAKRGLYAKIPGEDFLGNGEHLRVIRPCLCFTELRLGESTSHWHQYGRMAFGFSKATVAQWGGGPVAYLGGGQRDPSVKRLELLHRHLLANPAAGSEEQRISEAFEYLWHFFKRMRHAPSPKVGKRKGQAAHLEADEQSDIRRKTKPRTRVPPEARAAQLAAFQKWKRLPNLDEHEWRLVYSAQQRRWQPIATGERVETAWFNIRPGHELLAVVLPDNRTVQRALGSPRLREQLLGSNRPPVQLLSLEAVMRL